MNDSAARPNTHPIVDRLLVALLVIFALAAGTYSVLTPLFEMSDELWHYPMVKTLADGNGLPVQDPANPGPWKQEGSQPPLYYALGAALTFWIDTSDVGEVLRPNPHVDNGVITEDGNANLIAHNYQRERWPWRGTVLAVHLVRFMSVAISTLGVYFTYRVGEELFPDKRWLALAGAAAMAFTPMFAFISGAVNNDNLAVTLAALSLWLMLRIVRQANAGRATWRWAAVLALRSRDFADATRRLARVAKTEPGWLELVAHLPAADMLAMDTDELQGFLRSLHTAFDRGNES